MGLSSDLADLIPQELADLMSLVVFDLEHNYIGGSIPMSFFDSFKGLRNWYLGHNRLTGTIPSQIGLLSNIENIWIDHNEFDGKIPTTIGFLSGLWSLYLQHNSLNGRIPT
jgi:hypothetical protein